MMRGAATCVLVMTNVGCLGPEAKQRTAARDRTRGDPRRPGTHQHGGSAVNQGERGCRSVRR